jgi:hypothetical protein
VSLISKIGGLLGGLAAGQSGILFPNNPLISDYGIDTGKLFRINLKAFQPLPVKLIPDGEKVRQEERNKANLKIAEFDVLYASESFTVNHQHNWDQAGLGGAIQGLMTSIGSVPGGLAGFGSTLNSMIELDPKIHTRRSTFGDIDVAPVYKGSGNQEIEVSFILLAHSDPIREVVLPAQLLTYLTYPKINGDQTIVKKLDELTNKVSNSTAEELKKGFKNSSGGGSSVSPPGVGPIGTGHGADDKNIDTQTKDLAQDNVNTFADGLVEHVKSTARFRVGIAPPVWVISCSNGSQFLGNAHCRTMGVSYHGPWLGAPPENSFSQAAQEFAQGASLGSLASSIFPGSDIFDLDFADIIKDTNRGGYPSYAVITMTFQSNYALMFGEEWLLSLGGGARSSKIKVS